MDRPEPDLDTRLKKMALILGWMLVGAGGLWFLTRVWPLVQWTLGTLSPFLIALVLAYIFNPIVNVVQKRLKLGRVGGIAVAGLVVVLIVVVFFGFLIPVLYVQVHNLFEAARDNLPGLISSVSRKVGIEDIEGLRARAEQVVEQVGLDIQSLLAKASPAAPSIAAGGLTALQGVATGLGAVAGWLSGVIGALVLVVVIAFYYLVEFDGIPKVIRLLLPARNEDKTMAILGKVDESLAGFLRGQLIVCTLVAIVASVGLAAIGMRQYAILVGVIAGAANVVPYLGPVTGAAPAVVWALCSSAHATWTSRLVHAGLVVAVFVLIQTLDGLVFQPRIVGKSSNLHPLMVLLALVIGAQFGLGGMIVAVPVACIARVLVKELWWDRHVAAKSAEA